MTDYSELVRKMRTCIGDKKCFEKECRYWSELGCMDGNICCDAADAIEALLKENKELIEDRPEMVEADGHWEWRKPNGEVLMPKRGEWIKRREFVEDWQFDGFRCSICNWWKGNFETYNYCPKCGAKMEVQDADS